MNKFPIVLIIFLICLACSQGGDKNVNGRNSNQLSVSDAQINPTLTKLTITTPTPTKSPTPTKIPTPTFTPTKSPTSTATVIKTPQFSQEIYLKDDYSTDPLNPTNIPVNNGELLITNTFGDGNKDYVTFNVEPGFILNSIILTEYTGEDKIAFFAIQSGPQYTAANDITQMLVYGHFGPNTGYRTVGENILIDVNKTNDGKPSQISLEEGMYTIWIQQGASTQAHYKFLGMLSEIKK